MLEMLIAEDSHVVKSAVAEIDRSEALALARCGVAAARWSSRSPAAGIGMGVRRTAEPLPLQCCGCGSGGCGGSRCDREGVAGGEPWTSDESMRASADSEHAGGGVAVGGGETVHESGTPWPPGAHTSANEDMRSG